MIWATHLRGTSTDGRCESPALLRLAMYWSNVSYVEYRLSSDPGLDAWSKSDRLLMLLDAEASISQRGESPAMDGVLGRLCNSPRVT